MAFHRMTIHLFYFQANRGKKTLWKKGIRCCLRKSLWKKGYSMLNLRKS
nr:acetyl-CoA carboxylase beta subunit [Reaumuria songarica]